MMKNKNGITLIALVITIMVLLVLIGITLSIFLGKNGVLSKAQEAKIQSDITEEKETILFAANAAKMKNQNHLLQYKELNEELENKNVEVIPNGKNFKIKFNESQRTYKLKGNGELEIYEDLDPKVYGTMYGKLDSDGTLYIRSSLKLGYNKATKWNSADIKKVVLEEKVAPTTTANMFQNCTNLESIQNIENLHTDNVTSMASMFSRCSGLTTLDVSNFDTSKVTNMGVMFYNCSKLSNLNLSNKFTINSGTTTNNMFSYFSNITIKAKQDTATKIKSVFPQFTDSNFEIVS